MRRSSFFLSSGDSLANAPAAKVGQQLSTESRRITRQLAHRSTIEIDCHRSHSLPASPLAHTHRHLPKSAQLSSVMPSLPDRRGVRLLPEPRKLMPGPHRSKPLDAPLPAAARSLSSRQICALPRGIGTIRKLQATSPTVPNFK